MSRRAIVLRMFVSCSALDLARRHGRYRAARPELPRRARRPRRRSGRRGRCPRSELRSMPRSRAIRRASGEALTRPPVSLDAAPAGRSRPAARGGGAAACFGSSCGAGSALGVLLGETSSPSSPIKATVWPTGTSPSLTAILSRTPRGLGLDLLGDLVGVELVERLALLYRSPSRLEPADDRAGLHALAEPREHDLGRHASDLPVDGSLDRRPGRPRRAARRTPPSPARTAAARTSRRRARSARRASRRPGTGRRPRPRRRSPSA